MIEMLDPSEEIDDLRARLSKLETNDALQAVKALIKKNGGNSITEKNVAGGVVVGLLWQFAGHEYQLQPNDATAQGWANQRDWLESLSKYAPLGFHGTLATYSERVLMGIFRRSSRKMLLPKDLQRIMAALDGLRPYLPKDIAIDPQNLPEILVKLLDKLASETGLLPAGGENGNEGGNGAPQFSNDNSEVVA